MALSVLLVVTGAGEAAGRTAIGLGGGGFLPLGALKSETAGAASVTCEHAVSAAFTGWARFRLGPVLNAELRGTYAPANVDCRASLGGQTTSGGWSASLWQASAILTLDIVKPAFRPYAVHVSAGGGIVSRGGAYFADHSSGRSANVAGVLGVGGTYAVARSIHLRADVMDVLSTFEPIGGGSSLQNDVLLTLGLELTLGSN
ncbi:MAG: hypothetical protein IPK64_18400 [bacterium]|nr:hypothetical protein [bacterium]